MRKWLFLLSFLSFFLFSVSLVKAVIIPVYNCRDINQTGVWELQNDINTTISTCFNILSDDVYFDMNGYTVYYTYTHVAGTIFSGSYRNNVEIRNGEAKVGAGRPVSFSHSEDIRLKNFTARAINPVSQNIYFSNVTVGLIENSGSFNNSYGLYLLNSYNVTIEDSSFKNNTGYDIYISGGAYHYGCGLDFDTAYDTSSYSVITSTPCPIEYAEIKSLIYPTGVISNSTHTISMTIKNTYNTTMNYTVGLTIGKDYNPIILDFEGVSCNEPCYVADYVLDNCTPQRKWVAFLTNVPAGETISASVQFQFKPEYFTDYQTYDIVAAVWNYTVKDICEWFTKAQYEYDEWVDYDAIYVSPTGAPPLQAEIVYYEVSETSVVLGEEITVKAWIHNTGTTAGTFYYGLSIGNYSAGYWCNRDCYTDGLGDYATIYLGAGHTGVVQRKFKFDTAKYPFIEGRNYDLRHAVYDAPYISFADRLDGEDKIGYISIVPLYTRAFAYSLSAQANKVNTSHKDVVTIRSYILSNGSISYNFTLGMSIGLWNAVNGTVYSSKQPQLIPPCNVECYRDDLGDWIWLYIPPNYTAPFERKFYVPEYFLVDTPIDVAVGVWTAPAEEGGQLFSIVYWKNITFVSSIPTAESMISESLRAGMSGAVNIVKEGFGVDESSAKFLIWAIFTIVVTVLVLVVSSTSNFIPWQLGIIIVFLMSLVGLIFGYVPAWIGIVFIIITGFILANWIKGIVT